MTHEDKRYSLIRLIINAGLEEDFIEWLNNHGYHDFFGRLDNVPVKLIEEYVSTKKLLDDGDDHELLEEIYSIDYEDSKRGYIKARKH